MPFLLLLLEDDEDDNNKKNMIKISNKLFNVIDFCIKTAVAVTSK